MDETKLKELEWIGSARKEFQKKAKHGIATPNRDLYLIRERLKRAEMLYTSKNKDD